MKPQKNINEYVQSLLSSKRMNSQVVFNTTLPSVAPSLKNPSNDWSPNLKRALQGLNISHLYRHQTNAIEKIRSGQHVVVATPTASGKTLIYNLPVLEKIDQSPQNRALYLFPLKALAQDQLKSFEKMASFWNNDRPTAAIYDGDTTAWFRKKIRENPPNVLMTNPDMLHLSILPYHQKWATFLRHLKVIVVDEVHTYRGVLGSHMAQVFRRLIRICGYYGTVPTIIFSSATIGNPCELAEQLIGMPVSPIEENGAPQGKKHILFLNPITTPANTAILLLKAALHRGLRTIVYTQSRKYAELIALWTGSKSGPFIDRICAYRAGLLPEERREIEAKLSNGELLAVISTSALELGIDIGDLDLCLLVGFPGSVMATFQRGGRVGRNGQDAAWVLIAGDDAMDQYFMRYPHELIEKPPEKAVLNPFNPAIVSKHLCCAAAEHPIHINEAFYKERRIQEEALRLEHRGMLLRGEKGDLLFARQRHPHKNIDLRGTGQTFQIISNQTGEHKGDIDAFRAFRETHPGAVYLHQGNTFIVDTLDVAAQTAKVSPAHVDYYTRVRGTKDTQILEVTNEKIIWHTTVYLGRLKVTDHVTGYERWRIHNQKKINHIPLDLPPQIFETEGIWIKIPHTAQQAAETEFKHFMGGIHAIEHAVIGISPLIVLADRNDLGGISIPFHPQVGCAAVFIYDSVPGGAGLSRQAFDSIAQLMALVLKIITDCPCESGCPSCVHSPKCGSGNRPIDKDCALFLLDHLKKCPTGVNPEALDVSHIVTQTDGLSSVPPSSHKTLDDMSYGVFDIETQRSAQEVGGWHKADLMGISCIVLYDSREDRYFEYLEHQVDAFIERLMTLERVVGFNNKRFDNRVLCGYSSFNFDALPTIDILEDIHRHLGYRLSLDHIAAQTLGIKKSADGLQALLWWKEGKISQIIDYCKTDVKITRDVFLYGRHHQYILFKNKAGNKVRIPVKW